jgi:protein-S-isoprenylcysteine O-methyltransferase Ste14
MHALKIAVAVVWVLFWSYWLISALGAKQTKRTVGRDRIRLGGLTVIALVVMLRVLRGGRLAVHSLALGVIGAALVATGITLAIWARVHLGRNWGMPMTERAEPELVTSGPYALVRHPIYTGLILGVFGTALVNNLTDLVVAVAVAAYFYYSAKVEERNLAVTFPSTYPSYQAGTKMLIPFVL